VVQDGLAVRKGINVTGHEDTHVHFFVVPDSRPLYNGHRKIHMLPSLKYSNNFTMACSQLLPGLKPYDRRTDRRFPEHCDQLYPEGSLQR
jgi:hypothetical protein